MRVVFMGSPPFAVPFLSALIQAKHEIVCVYSAPPRIRGRRGNYVEYSAVGEFALDHDLMLIAPQKLRKEAMAREFSVWQADVAVVVAYGVILPSELFKLTRYGCLNVHPSLLPRWRGAAPIERAIEAGDEYTGVTIMRMDEGLDTGPISLVEKTLIGERNAEEMRQHLAKIGTRLLLDALDLLEDGELEFEPQQGEPSYAQKITKEEAKIDWSAPAATLQNKIRALAPFPGAWCEMLLKNHTGQAKTERIKILNASLVMSDSSDLPKTCGDGKTLYITQCQRPGGRILGMRDFNNAFSDIQIL